MSERQREVDKVYITVTSEIELALRGGVCFILIPMMIVVIVKHDPLP